MIVTSKLSLTSLILNGVAMLFIILSNISKILSCMYGATIKDNHITGIIPIRYIIYSSLLFLFNLSFL